MSFSRLSGDQDGGSDEVRLSPLGFAAFILIAVVAGAIIGLVTRALLARLHDWRSTAASEIAPEASSIQESPVNFEEASSGWMPFLLDPVLSRQNKAQVESKQCHKVKVHDRE